MAIEIGNRSVISILSSDDLTRNGFILAGLGGQEERGFDRQDILLDGRGEMIYHPLMYSCFEEVEAGLVNYINSGRDTFSCGRYIFKFRSDYLEKPVVSNEEKKFVYQNADRLTGRPSEMVTELYSIKMWKLAMMMYRDDFEDLGSTMVEKSLRFMTNPNAKSRDFIRVAINLVNRFSLDREAVRELLPRLVKPAKSAPVDTFCLEGLRMIAMSLAEYGYAKEACGVISGMEACKKGKRRLTGTSDGWAWDNSWTMKRVICRFNMKTENH